MKIKQALTILFMFLLGVQILSAQNEQPLDSPNDSTAKEKVSWFAAGGMGVSSLADRSVTSFTLGTGVIINDQFLGGLYGSITPAFDVETANSEFVKRVEFGQFGLWTSYYMISSIFHYGIDMKFGAGKVNFEYNSNLDVSNDATYTDNVFVVMPALSAGVDITPFLQLNLDLGYRFVSGLEEATPVFGVDITKDSLSDLFGSVTLIFKNI